MRRSRRHSSLSSPSAAAPLCVLQFASLSFRMLRPLLHEASATRRLYSLRGRFHRRHPAHKHTSLPTDGCGCTSVTVAVGAMSFVNASSTSVCCVTLLVVGAPVTDVCMLSVICSLFSMYATTG
ncbi:hypothetical protein PR003_g27926 [Phytophthora rubi]|uniref:Uncharacterized protein n=1 Tax=Phytophthora rubi TaxID=129364 RepID=A0A6A3HWE0_9STRA|nr:hypothetical protein PF003_g37153 [Phytophthora fragariae]KAE8972068.1 hypothetical protein PR001_g26712 [Phytophthora rubi]KAE9280575.1 hypothetical protein PR003_g27926 [Phytophthora rubi]